MRPQTEVDENLFSVLATGDTTLNIGFHSLNNTTLDAEQGRDTETARLGLGSRKDSGFFDGLAAETTGVEVSLDLDKTALVTERFHNKPKNIRLSQPTTGDLPAHTISAATSPQLNGRSKPPRRRSSTVQRSTTTCQTSRAKRSYSYSQGDASLSTSVRPKILLRGNSSAYSRADYINPFLIPQRGGQVLEYSEGTLSDFESPFLERDENIIESNYSASTKIPTPSLPELDTDSSSLCTDRAEATPNHIPATVIDWTSPSTRRREYEEIDKSCRGVRGLWRRFAPRWVRSNSRLKFYDSDDGSDAGSVRRYRLNLPEPEHDDEKNSPEDFEDGDVFPRPAIARCKSSWSYFRDKSRTRSFRRDIG